MNQAALQVHGFRNLSEMNRHLQDYAEIFELRDMGGELLPLKAWPIQRVIGGDCFSGLELRVYHKGTGSEKVCEYAGAQVPDIDGRPNLAIVTVRDVTERKSMEQALILSQLTVQRQLAELEAIYDSAHVGLCVFDTQLRYQRINERLAQINGLPVADHIGKTVREIAPDLGDQAEAILHKIIKTGQPVLDVHLTGTTGASLETLRTWKEQWLPIKDETGKVVGINVAVEEITEQLEAEEALKRRVEERTAELSRRATQLSQLSSQLTIAEQRERRRIAEILHDHLQQLIVTAKLGQEILISKIDPALKAEAENVLNLISQSIRASRSLTSELSPPVLRSGNLSASLEWLARWVRENQGFEVGLQIESDIILDRKDLTVLLFQSVRELLFNVLKHAGVKAARIEMAHGKDNRLKVAVIDQGAGFEPDAVWLRAEAAGGFGLFSIGERLKLMGGSLEVESSPGKGAAFRMVVPLDKRRKKNKKRIEKNSVRPSILDSSADKLRVLLADDHTVFRQGLAVMLNSQSDIEVSGEAPDGEKAIELTRRIIPDVILMDINMPNMDGLEATRIIHSEFPHIRIVGLSMYDAEDEADRLIRAGATAYRIKSENINSLLAVIRGEAEPNRHGPLSTSLMRRD